MRSWFIILWMFVCLAFQALAQHQTESEEGVLELNSGKKSHFRIALLIGHSVVPLDENGSRSIIPCWGIDLEFWINHKFGLGIYDDLEMMSYVIDRGEIEGDLIREYPEIITMDFLFKPFHKLILFAGIGKEFEKNEDFLLYRMGIEYEIPINEKWDVCPSFAYDSRKDAFNTCSIMLGLGRRF